jgi:glycosyltransferase involved in cell wall biosynthesis
VRSRYLAADVALFPSEWAEPFGLVGLEAMACATPLVATGTGGSGEYLRHEVNALVVAPGDPAALAAAVRRLAGDAALRRRLVASGRRTASRFTAGAMADELEAWHAAAAARFAGGAPTPRKDPAGGPL